MRIVLASITSLTCGTETNKNRIINLMRTYSGKAELILLGEAFLQGFYALNFNYEHDRKIALPLSCDEINEIQEAALKYHTGVSFGMLESDGNFIYSSQITISPRGEIIDHFRRVSPGWKESTADEHYAEGTHFHCFSYTGKKICTALCGDLWFDTNVSAVNTLQPDIVFWPVYTDFRPVDWNTSIKHEYCRQAKRICRNVLYVNSVCIDQKGEEIAKGGSAFFFDGTVTAEKPSGQESQLLIDIVSVKYTPY